MATSIDRRLPQSPTNALGSGSSGIGVRTSYDEADDETISGHLSRPSHTNSGSGNNGPVQHSARVSRGLGAAGHEILGGSGDRSALSSHDRASFSKEPSTPTVQRISTPTNGGLFIDADVGDITPQLV